MGDPEGEEPTTPMDKILGIISQSGVIDLLLKQWKKEADLKPINRFIKTLKNHWEGIVSAMKTKLTNAYAESLNSIFQLAKARASGFSNVDSFMNMVYFLGNIMGQYLYKITPKPQNLAEPPLTASMPQHEAMSQRFVGRITPRT